MLFRRKKTEKPKTTLGLALYEYDNLIGKQLKAIFNNIQKKKIPSGRKIPSIISSANDKAERLIEDISKNNFKTDYRSDKAREDIIKMISGLKNILGAIGYLNIKEEALKIDELADKIKGLAEDRILLKKKMKDLESDYI